MKAILLSSNKIHNIIKDLEEKIIKGVKKRVNINLVDKFKYWLIYKKKILSMGYESISFISLSY